MFCMQFIHYENCDNSEDDIFLIKEIKLCVS